MFYGKNITIMEFIIKEKIKKNYLEFWFKVFKKSHCKTEKKHPKGGGEGCSFRSSLPE